MAKKHVMTPARRAALRKAQLASAKKRHRSGRTKRTVRRAGRSFNRAKNDPKVRKVVRRAAIGAAVGGIVAAHGYVAYNDVKTNRRKRQVAYANAKRNQAHYARVAAAHSRPHPKRKKARVASGGPTRHNRIFVTTSRGTTSVRKRTH